MDIVYLLIIGFFSGLFGGLMGIGGSVILLPALSILFMHRHPPEYQHVYQAAAMIMNFFVAMPAAIAHYRKQSLMGSVLKWLIPVAVVSIILGVITSNLPFFSGSGAIYLKKLLGVFLFYVIGYNIYKLWLAHKGAAPKTEKTEKIAPARTSLLVGLPMGFMAGLLGIGGGVLCVPLQQVLLRLPLTRAIANSSATIMAITFFGAIYKNATLSPEIGGPAAGLKLALLVVPTSFIGGYLGARLIYILPRAVIRIVFILLMTYAAVRLLLIQG